MFSAHHTTHRGVKLHYRQAGQGPAVMLIMGLGMPGTLWDELAAQLVDQGCRVILPDNRGVGRSQTPTTPWTMRDMGDDAAHILRDAGLDDASAPQGPGAVVCGVSMGGMVAQNLATRHPELVRGLVLCNTTCGLPHGQLIPPKALLALLQLALAPRSAGDQAQRRAHALLGHPDRAHEFEAFLARTTNHLRITPTPWRGMLFQLLAALSHNTGDALPALRQPTLVLVGQADALIPPKNSQILAQRIPGAQLRPIPDAGHILPHERPDAIRQAVLELALHPSAP